MKILCINIDTDTESWRLSQEQFEKVGLIVERVSAIVEDNRPLAFNKSVYKAMEMARGDELLLFEDDVMFDAKPPDFINEPRGWLTIHFGCNIIGTDQTVWKMPERHSEHLATLHNCWQSHATLYSGQCVAYILDNFCPNILDENNMIFDEWLRTNVLNQDRSYVLNPMIAYQRPRHSEIWNVESDYTGCHKQGNEFLKTLR